MRRCSFSHLVTMALLGGAIVLLLSGCQNAPAASDIAVSGAWVRAATVEADMAGGEDMVMAEGEEEGEAMDMAADEEVEGEAMDMAADEEGETMPMHQGAVSAAYMVIENRGGQADRLISAATDAAGAVEIHQTTVDEAGVARMSPLPEGLDIPANSSVALEPGGYHVMLMDLQQDLVAGETLSLTLTFESGQEVVVEAEVREP